MNHFNDIHAHPITIFFIAVVVLATTGTIVFGANPASRSRGKEGTHTSFSANSELIQYNGRWLPTPNRQGKLASFPYSSFDFTVYNTTYIALDLANLKKAPERKAEALKNAHQIALTPHSTKLGRYGPIDILLTINGTVLPQRLNSVHGRTMVVRNLNPLQTHRIRVRLEGSAPQGTIQISAIVLEYGGRLLSDSGARLVHPASRRKLVEILTTQYLDHTQSSSQVDYPNLILPWFDLLERGFTNTTFSVLSFPSNTCLSRLCQAQDTISAPIKNTYFRAGATESTLHSRLWSPAWGQDIPSVLLMLLGLADIESLLDRSRFTKHQITEYVEDFARGYATFIQTIRRTAYSSSVLESMQRATPNTLAYEIDESYLYNSASSGVPIFLIVPPYPPCSHGVKARYMRTLLTQALQKVLNELKWHIGDKNTFIIDTAGWLDDEDFTLDNENKGYAVSQSGHVKFAYRISSHLCRYLQTEPSSLGVSKCPFARHEEYIGNLYVPETASLGKLVQERKIARMKEQFDLE